MDKQLIIRGLPHLIARDGWWLTEPPSGDKGAGAPSRLARGLVAMLFLIALADFLFWQQRPGLSVALFAGGIFAVAACQSGLAWRRPALLLLLAALPVIDHLQALSFALLTLGLVAALVWARFPEAQAGLLAGITARFLARLPRQWLGCLNPRRLFAWRSGLPNPTQARTTLQSALRNWAMPVGGSLILVSLLLEANPVLAQLLNIDLDLWQMLRRTLFWAGIAVLVSPFLRPISASPTASKARTPNRLTEPGINAGSVLRALVLFNLLIGVQSLTDLTILMGGATLPPGMTMAEFAHRGAYPLLATAILAGVFALTAQPFLGEHRLIQPLLLVWLVQNMVLCGAAALRLQLYIGSFGLTYLRVHALIWMGLVAAGLGLVIWQVLGRRSNRWLSWRVAGLTLATLYLCSFVNFAQLIAAQNVTRADPDQSYLCSLGPTAAGPIVESGIGRRFGGRIHLTDCSIPAPRTRNWREWGFRTWRADRYVQQAARTERP